MGGENGVETAFDIALILASSPKLEYFKLSVDREVCSDFLDVICDAYKRRFNGTGLSLKHFNVGEMLHIPSKHMLENLTDLSVIEKLQVGGDCRCSIIGTVPRLWEIFSPAEMPNLKELSVMEILHRNWDLIAPIVSGKIGFKLKEYMWEPGRRARPLVDLAQGAKVPMLQVPLAGVIRNDTSWFFKDSYRCEWLTHLKVIAPVDVCGLNSKGGWLCCLPALCDEAPQLPNLVALSFGPERELRWLNCHGKQELAETAKKLMNSCAKLEYVELHVVAFAAKWREVGSGPAATGQKTWQKLDDAATEMRRPMFFADS
ncbi:hypothetical protein PWT90_00578 [Aphanocladium album]|nr:hypothetical protein PWT90_00578 [Aphanocladium album]